MGTIQNAMAAQAAPTATAIRPAGNNITATLNSYLDRDGLRKRFDELLGKRSPQFISSIVSMVNADANMQLAFRESPMSVIQAALKAATFDLPIDQNLGYAYIIPFKNWKKEQGKKVTEASFLLGWKGMHQLALRTGAYKVINVTDVRDGELKSYNRLTEEIDIEFYEDEDERNKQPIIGYVGYYRLVNGAEKTIYMSKKAIEAHERKHRKGEYMGKGWKDDWDAMARKTVYRQLIGKWGVMSIDYQSRAEGQHLADAMAADYAATDAIIDAEYSEVSDDTHSGEIIDAPTTT